MYDIRHLWITTMLDKGIEPSVIASLAGTSVEMILDNYYEPHAVERNRVAEVLPAIIEEPAVEPDRKVVGIADAPRKTRR
jgi:integrase